MNRRSARAWLAENAPLAGDACLYIPNLKLTRKGYARIRVFGRMTMAHRYVYEHLIGPVPDGMEPDHTCDNRACCNPRHLQLLTHAENVREITRRGRHFSQRMTHCKNGHPRTPENLSRRVERGANVSICLPCARDRTRRYQARLKAALGVAAFAVGVMAFPSVGLLHHNTVSCQSPGVWLIVNSEADKAESFTTNEGHSGDIPAGGSTTVEFSGTALTVYGTWTNGVTNTAEGFGDCTVIVTTTASPTTTIVEPTTTTEAPTSTTIPASSTTEAPTSTTTSPTTTSEPSTSSSTPSTTGTTSTEPTVPSSTSTTPPSAPPSSVSTSLPPPSSESPTVPPSTQPAPPSCVPSPPGSEVTSSTSPLPLCGTLPATGASGWTIAIAVFGGWAVLAGVVMAFFAGAGRHRDD